MVMFWFWALVAALYFAAWGLDIFRGWQCRRNGEANKADHVRALGVQLYLAKGYDQGTCFLLMNNTRESKPAPKSKASRRQR